MNGVLCLAVFMYVCEREREQLRELILDKLFKLNFISNSDVKCDYYIADLRKG